MSIVRIKERVAVGGASNGRFVACRRLRVRLDVRHPRFQLSMELTEDNRAFVDEVARIVSILVRNQVRCIDANMICGGKAMQVCFSVSVLLRPWRISSRTASIPASLSARPLHPSPSACPSPRIWNCGLRQPSHVCIASSSNAAHAWRRRPAQSELLLRPLQLRQGLASERHRGY